MVIHADVEVEHHEDRGLQAVGKIESLGTEFEALSRILREEQNVLGVAVRGVSTEGDIALLRAGWHAGRWAGPLDIENNRRDFSEIGQSDELLHQGDAGS